MIMSLQISVVIGVFLTINTFQWLSFVVYQAISFVFLIVGFKEGVITAGDFALLLTINISIVQCLWSLSGKMLELIRI